MLRESLLLAVLAVAAASATSPPRVCKYERIDNPYVTKNILRECREEIEMGGH